MIQDSLTGQLYDIPDEEDYFGYDESGYGFPPLMAAIPAVAKALPMVARASALIVQRARQILYTTASMGCWCRWAMSKNMKKN